MRHYYFRLNEQEGAIYWSRSRDNSLKKPSKALVLQVHKGASNAVKDIPKFSPADLHCYTFWVATGGGVLDLFAYNEEAFRAWLSRLELLSARNAGNAAALHNFKNSSVYGGSRPVSSRSTVSRSSVVPTGTRASLEHDDSASEGGIRSSGRSASIFTVPKESETIDRAADLIGVRPPTVKTASRKNVPSSKYRQVSPGDLGSPDDEVNGIRGTHLESFLGESFKSHDNMNQSEHVTYSNDII